MKDNFDILIIGGGLVGASLAVALRASSLRLGVIEAVPLVASSQPSYDDRTLALAYGSKRIFESVGVWNEIAPDATPIERIHISDRGHFGITRLSAAEVGMTALGYVVANRALGVALMKTLQTAKNIEWLCPAGMQEIKLTPESASVTVRHNDVSKTLTTRLVIAADGAYSAVRAAMGIEAQRTEYRQSAIVTTVTAGEPHGNTAYERFTYTGPLALLPLTDNRCSVVWSAKADEVPTITGWSDAEFLNHLQDRFGDRLGTFTRPGKRTAYPLALTRVQEQVRERLPPHRKVSPPGPPVAGQGFNPG